MAAFGRFRTNVFFKSFASSTYVRGYGMKVPERIFLHEVLIDWLWIDGGRVWADMVGTGISFSYLGFLSLRLDWVKTTQL